MVLNMAQHLSKYCRLIVAASCLLFSQNLFAGQTAKNADTTLLVFGDSLSAAYGIAQEQGWVALLQQRLAAQHKPYRVANASISGETTAGGLARLPAALNTHKPAIVVLELGANDGLRGLPIAQMQANLDAMLGQIRQAGAKAVLVGMRIPPNYGPQYTRQFQQVYTTLAAKYNVPLVPFLLQNVAGKPELNQGDGIHPKAAAQPMVLENVWTELQRLI